MAVSVVVFVILVCFSLATSKPIDNTDAAASLKHDRRSDDGSPLQAVVDQLTQQVSALLADEAGLSGEESFTPHDETGHYETHHVTFSPPFSAAPIVTLGLTYLDAYEGHNLRVKTYMQHLASTGFDLRVQEWADSYNYRVNVMWMACPK
ncbi:hypothetical protein BaRGS_00040304 [Batillaria attramentaria]|uniref:H-type lectin domain-containing protein n=1 Tax=Batillaria attramentaria TaxID=370345 RepID=A0ABD0J0Q9_9CAEN